MFDEVGAQGTVCCQMTGAKDPDEYIKKYRGRALCHAAGRQPTIAVEFELEQAAHAPMTPRRRRRQGGMSKGGVQAVCRQVSSNPVEREVYHAPSYPGKRSLTISPQAMQGTD